MGQVQSFFFFKYSNIFSSFSPSNIRIIFSWFYKRQIQGLFFIIPCMDTIQVVDLRTVSFDVPPQEILTKDSVTVAVDAVVYYKVFFTSSSEPFIFCIISDKQPHVCCLQCHQCLTIHQASCLHYPEEHTWHQDSTGDPCRQRRYCSQYS